MMRKYLAAYFFGMAVGLGISLLTNPAHCEVLTNPQPIQTGDGYSQCEVLTIRTPEFVHTVLHCGRGYSNGAEALAVLQSVPRKPLPHGTK